ncbi:HelD family protein [Streptomyces malaysiensis]|uniref:AAA family ATPase n=1 Tax=Streptomyces malaysiensis subsp. samsunensis TaxID=459658 RepID=A0A9X2M4H9_STRMQ|nr:ATP-binding domain-containing protein [Streptomyces samsunensis]MCQ8833299.1 AAA family ATPase [Streptomyces samsunensis]
MSNEEWGREQEFLDLLNGRLAELRAQAEEAVTEALTLEGTTFQARLERDVLVAERSGLLAAFEAGERGLCFGRLIFRDGRDHHIGRIGIRRDDEDRTPLVVDWRADVARPFYLATGHTPMGLRRRRHITTEGPKVTGLHDEILDLSDTIRTGHEGSDADAVLLAALDAARTGRMHDIVQTIQAEQDQIIRAPHRGVHVVEGGPGTGKTVVALHRAAYLLYAHRESLARRAVLIVGPNPAFLGYIGEVLPSLGETGVLLATVGELFPGVTAAGTDTPEAAEVKGRAEMADVLARCVRDRQTLPDPAIVIPHDDGELVLDKDIASEAGHKARETGLPHNLARPHFAFRVIDALTGQLVDRIGADPYGGPNLLGADDIAQLGKAIAVNPEVHAAIQELWPALTPQRLVADFLDDPRRLSDADAAAIRRTDGEWTPADVPLLDEAAELLGHDDSAARAAEEAERQERIDYAQGVLDLSYGSRTLEFEDREDEESEVLAAHDLIDAERLADRAEERDHRSAAERAAADRTWAFGHIIVDEAQELPAMAWRLLMRRSPTRSMTLVGDPAQTAEPGGCGSWSSILEPYVGDRWEHTRLGVNYRTPTEIMEVAARVARTVDPAFQPPRSVRATGVRPWAEHTGDLPGAVAAAVARETRTEGRLAVIAPKDRHDALSAALPQASTGRSPDLTSAVVLLDPRQAKGLEFDTVIVAEPAEFGTSDLYVALTRATQRLGVLHTGPLPEGLRDLTGSADLFEPTEPADHEGSDGSAGTVMSRNSARASSV